MSGSTYYRRASASEGQFARGFVPADNREKDLKNLLYSLNRAMHSPPVAWGMTEEERVRTLESLETARDAVWRMGEHLFDWRD